MDPRGRLLPSCPRSFPKALRPARLVQVASARDPPAACRWQVPSGCAARTGPLARAPTGLGSGALAPHHVLAWPGICSFHLGTYLRAHRPPPRPEPGRPSWPLSVGPGALVPGFQWPRAGCRGNPAPGRTCGGSQGCGGCDGGLLGARACCVGGDSGPCPHPWYLTSLPLASFVMGPLRWPRACRGAAPGSWQCWCVVLRALRGSSCRWAGAQGEQPDRQEAGAAVEPRTCGLQDDPEGAQRSAGPSGWRVRGELGSLGPHRGR